MRQYAQTIAKHVSLCTENVITKKKIMMINDRCEKIMSREKSSTVKIWDKKVPITFLLN